jgi:DNA-binding transcriptional MocR family regulator
MPGERLPTPWQAENFTATARQARIAILPLRPFAVVTAAADQAVRITLNQAPTRAVLTKALRALRDILERSPNRPQAIIQTRAFSF